MISNIRKNIMGTVSFDAGFGGMRKSQGFIVYPIKATDDPRRIVIQSDTRIGVISTETGGVWLSRPHRNGANFMHLAAERALVDKLTQEELFNLKAHIFGTAHHDAGRQENGFIGADNSGARAVSL